MNCVGFGGWRAKISHKKKNIHRTSEKNLWKQPTNAVFGGYKQKIWLCTPSPSLAEQRGLVAWTCPFLKKTLGLGLGEHLQRHIPDSCTEFHDRCVESEPHRGVRRLFYRSCTRTQQLNSLITPKGKQLNLLLVLLKNDTTKQNSKRFVHAYKIKIGTRAS